MTENVDFLSSALGVAQPIPEAPPAQQQAPEPIAVVTQDPPQGAPVQQEPLAQDPAKTEIDFSALLKEKTGGKVENFDQLQQFLDINEKYASVNTEASELRSKVEQYEGQLKDRYANPLVDMLDNLYRNGANDVQIQTALQLQSLDLEGISGLEAKTRRMMFEKGWTREDALDEINAQYKLDENKFEPDEIERDLKRIERNKTDDIKYLSDLKKEATAKPNGPDPEKLRLAEQQKAELQTKVSSFVSTVTNQHGGLGSLELVSAKDNEDGISLELNFSEEFKKVAPEYAKQFMLQNGIEPSEGSLPAVKEYLNNLYFAANGKEIMKTVAAHVESTVLKRFTEQNSNRGGANRNQNPLPNAKTQDENDFLRSWALGKG